MPWKKLKKETQGIIEKNVVFFVKDFSGESKNGSSGQSLENHICTLCSKLLIN